VSVDRLYTLSFYLMIMLSIIPYTIVTGRNAQAHLVMTLLVIPLSYWSLEVRHKELISRTTSNVVIVCALVLGVQTYFQWNFIYAMGNLLVVVALARTACEKNIRDLYALFAIGVVLMCTAAALTSALVFGVFLGLYLIVAILAMLLFTLERDAESIMPKVDANHRMTRHSPLRRIASTRLRTSAGFITTSLFLFAVVIFGAAVIFLVWPRAKQPLVARSLAGDANPVTGFSETLQLNDLGQIFEDKRRVMDVRLFRNGQEHRISGESLYMRGVALARWDGMGWSNDRATADNVVALAWPGGARRRGFAGSVVQEITVQPLDTNVLFSLYRPEFARVAESREQVFAREHWGILLMTGRRKPVQYKVISRVHEPSADELKAAPRVPIVEAGDLPAVSDELLALVEADSVGEGADTFDWIMPLNDRSETLSLYDFQRQYERFVSRYLSTNYVSPRVKDLAGEIAPRTLYPSDYEIAAAVQRYLEDPENFAYTLNLESYGDDADPIEQFLLDDRKGHCSLFASAMVLMLRCQGVPSRIVNGFRGGRWSEMTRSYAVQSNYAHSWVEVYFRGHGWVVFDPSPAVSADLAGQRYLANWREELEGWFQMQWNRFVIGFKRSHQKEIYTKVTAVGEGFAKRTQDWIARRSRALAAVQWQNLSGGARVLAGFVSLLLALGLWFMVKRILPRLARRAFGEQGGTTGRFPIPRDLRFYPLLLEGLAREGFARRASVPPLAFAEGLCEEAPQVGGPLAEVTGIYYRARFGLRQLSREEQLWARELARRTLEASRRGKEGA